MRISKMTLKNITSFSSLTLMLETIKIQNDQKRIKIACQTPKMRNKRMQTANAN